jgi:hypothetical protein
LANIGFQENLKFLTKKSKIYKNFVYNMDPGPVFADFVVVRHERGVAAVVDVVAAAGAARTLQGLLRSRHLRTGQQLCPPWHKNDNFVLWPVHETREIKYAFSQLL